MATITKKVDKGVEPVKRYQFWLSSEDADDGTVITAGDIFMIEDSIGRPASYVRIETAAGTDLQIRLNSKKVAYGLRDARLNWPIPSNDLEIPVITHDDTMAAIPIDADATWELSGILPVSAGRI